MKYLNIHILFEFLCIDWFFFFLNLIAFGWMQKINFEQLMALVGYSSQLLNRKNKKQKIKTIESCQQEDLIVQLFYFLKLFFFCSQLWCWLQVAINPIITRGFDHASLPLKKLSELLPPPIGDIFWFAIMSLS